MKQDGTSLRSETEIEGYSKLNRCNQFCLCVDTLFFLGEPIWNFEMRVFGFGSKKSGKLKFPNSPDDSEGFNSVPSWSQLTSVLECQIGSSGW